MKKQNFFKLLSLFLVTSAAFAQVQKAQTLQVGNTSTNTQSASAALQIDSTTKGLLPPRMTQTQRNAIATPATGLMVWCTDCGTAGELQVYNGTTWTNSVGATASGIVPGAPTSPVATAGNAQASVAFTAPASAGGSAITGYTVTSSPGGLTATGASSPLVVTSLTNGTSYTFTVVATNASGNSVASAASSAVTPFTIPGAPTSPVATAGNAQASIAFTAPVSNGGSIITSYTATSNPEGRTGTLNQAGSGTITVTGLTNGTAYTFTVVATNAAGNSSASTASSAVTPFTVPGAPTSPVATLGNAQASVAFTAPASNGGSTITGYTVTSSPGNFTSTGASSPRVVTGLTNGTAYTFTVVATNAAGNSSASTASAAVTPFTVPGAPTSPVATAGNAQASVAFTAPASNGGSAITGYTVTSSSGGFTATGASSPLVVTGLTNGTSYSFTVVATNAAGNSSASVASAAVTPSFTCGTSTVTFTYNGASVTYGTVTGANSKCWLNRNLGATQVATGSTDAASYGDLFQWGRGADGHQIRTSGTTTGQSTSTTPGSSFLIGIGSTNWYIGTNPDLLWQGVSGTNNPCPSGYRLPTEAEWEAERNNGGTGFWGTGSAQNNAAGAFASPLKLPEAEFRLVSDGTLYGSTGSYWSSGVNGTNSRSLGFGINYAGFGSNNRAIGRSVRCIKD